MTIRGTELVIVGQDYTYVIEDPYAVSGLLLRRAITNHKHGRSVHHRRRDQDV